SWTYSAANAQTAIQSLASGATIHDVFAVQITTGGSQLVDISIVGTNDVPVISGTLGATVTEDVNLGGGNIVASGTLGIVDIDSGQSTFQAATAAGTGTLGVGIFTIDSAGHWTYSADNSDAIVQGLPAGQTLTDV